MKVGAGSSKTELRSVSITQFVGGGTVRSRVSSLRLPRRGHRFRSVVLSVGVDVCGEWTKGFGAWEQKRRPRCRGKIRGGCELLETKVP